MARPLRQIVPGGVYHITTRGNNRQAVFLDEEDRESYLDLLRDAKKAFSFRLYLYVLMTNHVHLLLRTSDNNQMCISAIMKSLTLRYTKRFNKKYERSGNLFQPKYFSNVLEADSHLLELTRYIHLNPVRARMVENINDYPYSSCHSYFDVKPDDLVDREEILEFFGQRPSTQRERYRKFVEEGISLWKLRSRASRF